MQHRIALCGFSEFEYRAMHFSFQHPIAGEPGYEVVDAIADADFAIVDADSKPAVKGVVLSGRVAQAVFVGAIAPPGAAAVVPRPIDLSRITRALTELAARSAAPTPFPTPFPADQPTTPWAFQPSMLPASEPVFSDPDEIVFQEPPLLTEAVPLARVRVAPPPPPAAPLRLVPPAVESLPQVTPEIAAHNAKKAAARAAARRARLSQVHTSAGQLEQVRDVLVLDSDTASSAHLSGLLELFGFRVHVVHNIAHAADVMAQHPLVAAFLDISFDAADQGDGLVFLQTIHDLPRLVGHPAPAVLVVSAQLQPADRVRAALAGIASPLLKPVTRGDVARALEACDVLLPADARRL